MYKNGSRLEALGRLRASYATKGKCDRQMSSLRARFCLPLLQASVLLPLALDLGPVPRAYSARDTKALSRDTIGQ